MTTGEPGTGGAQARVCVVVLAGGESRRFGSDKLAADLDGVPVLDRLLSALPSSWAVVLVGPRRDVGRAGVQWVREEPPGGGPAAAVQAGSACSTAPVTAVVAGDMPYAAAALPVLVATLVDAPDGIDAVVAVDDDGHANPLLAAYRTHALKRALPVAAHGIPAKRLLALRHVTQRVSGTAARDVDTPDDLAELREHPAAHPPAGLPGVSL